MTDQNQETIAALSRDVFFGMRIRTVLQQLGYAMKLCKTEAELLDANEGLTLVLVDFNLAVDWEKLSPLLAGSVPVIAFGAHTNVEGFRAAKSAGVTRVVSNGEFSRRLPSLLTQYRRNASDGAESVNPT